MYIVLNVTVALQCSSRSVLFRGSLGTTGVRIPGGGQVLQKKNEDSWALPQTSWIRISVNKAQKSLFVTGTPGDSYFLYILKCENHYPNS